MTGTATPPRVGCSGWNYRSWKGRFYPDDLKVSEWLSYYTTRFDTVETNNTFYRLPEQATFASWRRQMPASFVMAIKASRFLTHMKKLRDPDEPLQRLFARAAALGAQLGPVLYQLPGQFTRNLDRLEVFLQALPRTLHGRSLRHVMEFRDPSWYVTETFQLLEHYRVALCLHDKQGSVIDRPFVGPFVYARFHGTSGHYHGSYSDRALDTWARRLVEQYQDGKRVFAYFNNDPDAIATVNAQTLKTYVQELLKI